MKYGYKIPPQSIREYVKGILVIEDFRITNPFTLPLFANGCPTLVFQTKKALLNKESSGHFTLFGQTIKPGAFTINEDFTLIAYFFKPHALVSLFSIAGNELSDTHADLNLLKQPDSRELQEKLLNCMSSDDMVRRLILSIIAGFLFTAIVTTVVDHIFHVTKVYPPYGEPFEKTSLLIMAFAYRALFAITGAYITARIAKDKANKAVLILGILGTIAWLAGLVQFWDLAPGWYNIGGLILAIPYTFIGLTIYIKSRCKNAVVI